jgi:hypothetical protein
MRRSLFAIVIVCLFTVTGQAQIIDHSDIAGVSALPQSTLSAVGQQKWLFTHASVGGNMIGGMSALHTTDPTRYPLSTSSVGDDGSVADAPPASTTAGVIYDCNRGNPGWEAKVTLLDDSVRVNGWHDPAVTAVLNKLCYIDQDANATTYLNSMAALETAYPGTRFVYMTIPLTTASDADNILRNQYNTAVRSYCTTNGKLLFDIADIEAWCPLNNQFTFSSGGQVYQRMYSGYSSDGGHLNSTGSQRVAMGWYAVAAEIAVTGSGDTNAPDDADGTDDTTSPTETPATRQCGLGSSALLLVMAGLVGLKWAAARG